MPELPEVEITKRKLKLLLVGKRVLDLGKRKVLKVERKGKAILIYLSGDKILAFHQRMTGKLLVVDKNFRDKYVRFKYRLSSGKNLVFHDVRKFGVRWYGDAKKVLSGKYFSKLGFDPLEIDFKKFKTLFEKRKGMIKHLLLRQDILSGVGNIIANESLWKAGIHPQKKAEKLTEAEIRRLYHALRYIVVKSTRLGGSTMRDWFHPDSSRGGYFEKRYTYGRKGEKCQTRLRNGQECGKIIIRMKVAGRGTFICTSCQPEAGKPK